MRDLLRLGPVLMIWTLFFATSVYGHVALKVAVDRMGQSGTPRPALSALASLWGGSACLAWGVSCLLWTLALSQQRLQQVNALSSLRFVLVSLAAWTLLGERMSGSQVAGAALITAGILLVR